MNSRIVLLFVFLLGIFMSPATCAPALDKLRTEFIQTDDLLKPEQELLQDLADGQLNGCSLLEAALVVGGNDTPQVSALQSAFAASCRRCRAQNPDLSNVPGPLQLRQLFAYLLTTHLHGEYTPDLFDVGATLSHGEFNCLTATILFRSLCHEFDISLQAAWEPSHVRCWVPIETGRAGYLVETTADSAEAAISGLYPRSKLAERPLTPEQLLGKVFYNRGVRLLEQEQFTKALATTWASCWLDSKDVPAKNNLRACLNNWALSLSKREDYDAAIRLLDAGLQLDPNYEPFSRNLRLLERHLPATTFRETATGFDGMTEPE